METLPNEGAITDSADFLSAKYDDNEVPGLAMGFWNASDLEKSNVVTLLFCKIRDCG